MSLTGFVSLPENRSAFLAVRDLAEALNAAHEVSGAGATAPVPATLFLHGPPGSGKSHLVNGLGRELADRTSLASLVVSAERFNADDIHDQACQVELFAVEDVQHLPHFRAEGLAQLLDQRQARQKPTVLTARLGPHALVRKGEGLPARLLSRLAEGLVVELEPWSVSSRLVFLQELGRRRQLVFPQEIWTWLAEHLGGGGRQLEGAIRQLQCLSKSHPYNLSFDMVARHFQEQAEATRPTVERIVQKVSGHFAVKPRHLQSGNRARRVLLPRQVSMYLARRMTQLSLEQIGAYFGGRDHSTVLHACHKIEQAMTGDPGLSGAVRQLQAELT